MNFLIQKFIPDYENVENVKVRERYGTLISVLCILMNILLATLKLIFGIIANSVSIQADALNNYSDAGSNVATLFGFKLASKHPDKEHPYGHGRFEYVSGLVISFLIIMVALTSIKDSVEKIITPEKTVFSWPVIGILTFSILVKLLMAGMNKSVGERIHSTTLLAAGQDSINDTLTTFAAIVSMFINHYFDLAVDGYIGLFVSLYVFKAGIDVFQNTLGPLLGQPPDQELMKEIEDYVMSFDLILGVHDFLFHDYGPGRSFASLHVEVDRHNDILVVHDLVDNIEKGILEKFNVLTTIHMDPLDFNNEVLNDIARLLKSILNDINPQYSFHDLRMVSGPTHSNVLFDVVIPADDKIDESELKKTIDESIKKVYSNYFIVIEVDRSYY